jgi:hypothetical protein
MATSAANDMRDTREATRDVAVRDSMPQEFELPEEFDPAPEDEFLGDEGSAEAFVAGADDDFSA